MSSPAPTISISWRLAAMFWPSVVPTICRERGGFNRVAFHRTFNRDVVRFFSRTLHP